MKPKNENGDYFIRYVLSRPPHGADGTVWSVAVGEYLSRHGVAVENVTAHTTMANADFPEIRRIYNRLLGEGKQRRTADSHPAPGVLRVKGTL